MTARRKSNSPRRAELAKIHLLKKELGLDDETYRAMLWTIARVTSAGDADQQQRQAIIEHLKSRGAGGPRRGTPSDDRAPYVRKIRAILNAAQRTDAYADGMARHMFKVAKYTWCTPDQLRRLIAALAIDANRRAERATKPTEEPQHD